MARKKQSPPVGRPPRHKGERLSKNRTFRIRGGLDERLQHTADASGRSVSEEIEFRLACSFMDDDRRALIDTFVEDGPKKDLFTLLNLAISILSRARKDWPENDATRAKVRSAIIHLAAGILGEALPLEDQSDEGARLAHDLIEQRKQNLVALAAYQAKKSQTEGSKS